VAKYAESIGIQRIGLYDTFVHIGSATTKSFWLGHEHKVVETFGCAPQKTVTVELPVLRNGMKGEPVRVLQELLNVYGYILTVDGSFGAKTQNAVECYQEDADLEADGVCGKATWSKLLGA
jgi:hypothetical protein